MQQDGRETSQRTPQPIGTGQEDHGRQGGQPRHSRCQVQDPEGTATPQNSHDTGRTFASKTATTHLSTRRHFKGNCVTC